ncbi:MAG: DnaB-like helicase C-terminal domain-containing protein [bacterium]|nr:DnaB-like helicase C-terminal domain-containing protein [bacterium]
MCNQLEYPIQTIVNPLKRLLKDFDIRESEGRKEFLGFPFLDYKELNRIISGIRESHLTLLATSSSNLRSQFMLQIAISIICHNKIPVLYVSFEESPDKLLKQTLSQQTGLPMSAIERKKIKSNPELKDLLRKGLEKFAKFQSYLNLIAGSQSDTVEQLEIHLNSIKERYKTERVILMIDSLQRIPSYNYYPSENARVLDMANRLKLVANSQQIAVFAGSEITEEGHEIDATDNKDRITRNHCYGSSDLHRFADILMTVSKSWIDNTELQMLLRKKAELFSNNDLRTPAMVVLDLFIEKSPNNFTQSDCVQFLALLENGMLAELGRFDEQVLLRQNRIDKMVTELIDKKIIEFLTSDSNNSTGNLLADNIGLSTSEAGLGPDQLEKKKIKPTIRLKR